MAHEKPNHPSLSPQEKEGFSPPPSPAEDYQKKIDLLTDQLRNFKMGTAIGTAAILSMWAFSSTDMNTSGILIIGILQLVFLLFFANALNITYVTKILERVLDRIMPPRK